MDKTRKGEIALAMMKYKWSIEGIKIGPESKRELDSIAKATGISTNELKEFLQSHVTEFIEETFR